jgi:hypothetical protein
MRGLAMWERVAIVSEVDGVRAFTNTISRLLPGEYKGFAAGQLQEAIQWAAAAEEKKGPKTDSTAIPAHIEALLPAQTRGESTTTSSSVTAGKEPEAKAIFERASIRLMDVNQWTDHCGALTAGFQLTDDEGEPLEGRAAIGDYIRIDIPGPGGAEGHGYDWVKIEKLDQRLTPAREDAEEGTLSLLQVRPCHDPRKKDNDVTAHFLEDSATSTLIIERDGKKVSASVFGRNEVPNTLTPEMGDNVRHAVVGTLGAIGLSKIQWKALVQGLLERE